MVYVTPEPVQLVHQERTSQPPSLGHRGEEMRPIIVQPALYLNEVACYLKTLGRSEALDRFLLSVEAEPALALLLRADPVVGDCLLHPTLQRNTANDRWQCYVLQLQCQQTVSHSRFIDVFNAAVFKGAQHL